jgi:acetyl esterase
MTKTPFVRPDVAKFLEYLESVPGPRLHQLAPAEARALVRAMQGVADLPAPALAMVRDFAIPGPAGAIPARLYDAAETRAPGPVLLFLHGGGWVVGDIASYASPCAELARVLDIPVVAIDYRLAPEHAWPAAPEDCEAAARWIADSPDELGRSVTGLVLCGDSAGGNLTIVTALALRDEPAAVPVLVQAPLYPATDMVTDYPSAEAFSEGYLLTQDTMRWFGKAYAPSPSDRRASPLLHDLSGLPPAVIVAAGLDPIRDQGRAYAAALAMAGVPVTYREASGTLHGFLQLRRAIPSSVGDVAGFTTALKAAIAEAGEAE